MRPLVLLSNDDGYQAPGLSALGAELARFAEVVVCAPRHNQSAISHALTLSRPLRLGREAERTFVLDGTPADCVHVALRAGTRVLSRPPDLVVSGMNDGPNLGTDALYSGTVAAAREGALHGIASLAVSADPGADRPAAAWLAARLAEAIWLALAREQPEAAPLLNLNIPRGSRWPVRATRLGRLRYDEQVVFGIDPRGREYLWIGGAEPGHDATEGTDTAAWLQGVASLSPLALELGAAAALPFAETVARAAG